MSPTCNRQPRCFPKTSIGRSWHPERQGEQALCAPTQILQYDPQAPPHRIGVSRAEIRAEQGTADNQCGQVLHFGHHIKGLVHPLDSYRPNILHSHFGLANNETDTGVQRKSWKNKAKTGTPRPRRNITGFLSILKSCRHVAFILEVSSRS